MSITDAIVAMLETRYDYPMIILLHLLRTPSPAHFLCGRGKHTYYPMSKIGCFIPLVWQPPLLTGGYLQLQMWDLWSRRPDVPINQEGSQRPSLLWNSDSLNNANTWHFAQSCPFSQIHSLIMSTHTITEIIKETVVEEHQIEVSGASIHRCDHHPTQK